jgi:acetyltransferase-like isoleucine patch superfamily enzyme/acyl carrier protein
MASVSGTPETEALLQRQLERPGLAPRLCALPRDQAVPDAVQRALADPSLADRPAASWDPALLAAWRAGQIYLCDATSKLSDRCVVAAKRVIVRLSTVAAFSTLYGDDVVLDGSFVNSHCTVWGPVVLLRTILASNVVVGPFLVVIGSTIGAFSKAQRYVRIDRSLVAAGTLIEGGNHPEMLPLGKPHRRVGVTIGPGAWIGQQGTLTAGAVVGAGTVVAPRTSITRAFGEHVFVSGEPARAAPIDFAIRGLPPAEAESEGRAQGPSAWTLPVFGGHEAAFTDPRRLEIDYPQHGYLRDLCSENLLRFQRGVLAAAMAELFPDDPATIGYAVGKTVRFAIQFEKAPTMARSVDPYMARLWEALVNRQRPLPALVDERPAAEAAAPPAPAPPPAPAREPASTQQVITEILRGLLGPTVTIDLDTRFDALGLDSVGTVQLSVMVEDRVGVPTPDVFTYNTVRLLGSAVDRALGARA